MEYYLISLIITIIIFSVIQIYEYNKINKYIEENGDNYYIEPYSLYNMNNLLLLVILYIVSTISCYYLNVSKWKLFDNIKKVVEIKKTGGEIINSIDEFDPKILSKINDNFSVGFEPFSNDIDDSSSISSLSSSTSINIK
jgi:GTP1/Obg family GTP-binding protein